MAASSSILPESGATQNAYSRKQKSLGLLCSNFLGLYNREGVQSVGLDDAANRLGVERRRIYDIVNILESVGVLARKAKNQYTWKGFGAIPRALDELKVEGLKDNHSFSDGNDHGKQFSDDEDERYSSQNSGSRPDKTNQVVTQNSSSSSKPDNRREKSLGLLTQNFIKLFLCSNMKLISLDDAAKLLLGDGHGSTIMRTKVRRLYDIANVLISMNLIEKTHHTENRKPAFRWIGLRGKLENDSSTSLSKSNKRSFGTEITNIDFKRSRLDSASVGKSMFGVKVQEPVQVKCESLGYEDEKIMGHDSKVKTYEFGPFAPINVSRVQTTENKPKQVHDWENLATVYRPQYQNPALKELFGHYKDAWHTWHSEVVKK
uniref:E2F/DP family winged-helix DNA-binding domain-containing protein n=1 Tax=Kalanchoe fedtschenkoi TaxID=63787 RepID=A0A7N1A6I5_KALFE